MRVKKQKRHRRAVRFYTASFGFRQPFKILCDGTLVHNLIVNRVAPADNALSNILGGSVKLFTTSCVLDELKRLGNFYSESLQGAHKLMIARCDNENKKSAEACIVEILGENNPEHFFVATQDFDLRKKFREALNPLSCKKKKKKAGFGVLVNFGLIPQDMEYDAGDNAKRSRSRKRKRSHKGKNPAEMDSSRVLIQFGRALR
ncbi:hypothetical protein GH714_008604 [Hevea brasiliensis]|uniref:PIN domain-containing protein n=1 Tax=Hevea brasiliensis TaxID=3981 RepID=A0A6A6LIL1_HEVBR|nr:hypothetical protein GH714_008604 [Hevea brasiliensis]